jgi:uncharacterized membrane protein
MSAGTVFLVALISAAVAGGAYYLLRSGDEAPAGTGRPPATAPVTPGGGAVAIPESKEAIRGAIDQVRASIRTVRKELRRTEDPATRQVLKAQLQALRAGLRQLQAHLGG